ncbi:MAG: hypothetical protein WCJ42_08875 [Actinomycetes bacterium]
MEDLAGLLAAGERAAFRGSPASGVAALEQAIELAHATGHPAEAASATWLLGVCHTAVGRFAAGLEVFATLRAMVVDAVEPHRYASLAAAASAAAYRALGQHQLARSLDEEALGLSFGVAAAVFDARLGLASDAIGLGDPPAATEQLELASELAAARPDWWRQRVRLDWTRAELGIWQGRAGEALGFATAAVKLAEQSGAPRHVAKSLLFVGVSHVLEGDVQTATVALRRAGRLAENVGALPVVWPARALLGRLLAQTDPGESSRQLASAKSVVERLTADLPEELRWDWLARPDVADLLGSQIVAPVRD